MDHAITKYPYDPKRATELLADAGWRPQTGAGLSGAMLTNAEGKSLDVEMNAGSTGPQIATIIADNWKAIGVNSSVAMTPAANARDPVSSGRRFLPRTLERRTRRPLASASSRRSSRTPRRRSAGTSGALAIRRSTAHNRIVTSVDLRAQHDAYVALNQRMAALVAYSPIYYPAEILLARSRLTGPVGQQGWGLTWNLFDWEVTS